MQGETDAVDVSRVHLRLKISCTRKKNKTASNGTCITASVNQREITSRSNLQYVEIGHEVLIVKSNVNVSCRLFSF